MKLGLLGKNIEYSFSPEYFHNKFKKLGIENIEYQLFDLANEQEIPELFHVENLIGFNVTIPYKEKIINYLDELSEEAKAIGAVNTVKLQNKKWVGYNTDYLGFVHSLEPLLKENHKKALILGTGGASKAINYGFNTLGIQTKNVSRHKGEETLTYDMIDDSILNEFTIIVNTTPLGTLPNTETCPNIPYDKLTSKHLLYDLTYNPLESTFLKKGKKSGAKIKNGLEMLQLQAEFAWKIWY